MKLWTGVGGVCCALVFVGLLGGGGTKSISQAQTTSPVTQMTLRDLSWTKEFGSIMLLSGTIANDNAIAVKDIEITCKHSSRSGTEIDRNTRTIYDVVPAKGISKLAKFNMGFIHDQAATTACSVTRVKTCLEQA